MRSRRVTGVTRPCSAGLVVVRTEPGLLVRPWEAGVSPKALVADTVAPEVLPGLSKADPVRSAFVGRIFELNVVVVPPTHRAGLKRPRRRLPKGLVPAAWAGMLDWARRNWAPVGLAFCHRGHDGRPSEGLNRGAMYVLE